MHAPPCGVRAGAADSPDGGDFLALLEGALRRLGGRGDLGNPGMNLDGEVGAQPPLPQLLRQVVEHGGAQLGRTGGEQEIARLEFRQHELGGMRQHARLVLQRVDDDHVAAVARHAVGENAARVLALDAENLLDLADLADEEPALLVARPGSRGWS